MTTSIDQTIAAAQEYIASRELHQALSLLSPLVATNKNNAELLQTLATAHLEVSALPEEHDGEAHAEKAYAYFVEAANLDDANGKGDFEKYLWLGQLSGGRDAVEWFRKGCNGLRKDLSSEDIAEEKKIELRKKLCDALCASVEIWMTDLWYVRSSSAIYSKAILTHSYFYCSAWNPKPKRRAKPSSRSH